MARPRKDPPELLERGARVVIESRRPIAHVARDLGSADRRRCASTCGGWRPIRGLGRICRRRPSARRSSSCARKRRAAPHERDPEGRLVVFFNRLYGANVYLRIRSTRHPTCEVVEGREGAGGSEDAAVCLSIEVVVVELCEDEGLPAGVRGIEEASKDTELRAGAVGAHEQQPVGMAPRRRRSHAMAAYPL